MINLCFHGVGTPARTLETDEDHYWITTDLYHRVLDEVADRDDVALSFDDGNASDVEIGLPGLVNRGLTATFFVLAGRTDAAGSLGSEDLLRLAGAGMAIGTHGMDHVPWRFLGSQSLSRELDDARRAIAEVTGVAVDEAALPLGRYDRRVLAALKVRGYRRVHTSDRRRARAEAWLQPRYSLRATDTLESFRAEVLGPQNPTATARGLAVGLVKRLR